LIRLVRRPWPVVLVVADHLDDLDEAEGDPQPPQGRELVIVDLGHTTIIPPSSPEHRAAGLMAPRRKTGLGCQRRSGRDGSSWRENMTGCCGAEHS
jgi:hypothetical protein